MQVTILKFYGRRKFHPMDKHSCQVLHCKKQNKTEHISRARKMQQSHLTPNSNVNTMFLPEIPTVLTPCSSACYTLEISTWDFVTCFWKLLHISNLRERERELCKVLSVCKKGKKIIDDFNIDEEYHHWQGCYFYITTTFTKVLYL